MRPASDFKIGDRVKPTEYADKQFPTNKGKMGTVRGYSHNGMGIRVQRDGQVSISSYCTTFWEPAS